MKKTFIGAIGSLLIFGGANAQAQNNLTVGITNVKSTKGSLIVCLWTQADGFPDCSKSEPTEKVMIIPFEGANYTFEGLEEGVLAVSVLHDVNDDGKLKTNFVGAPKEPTGASNGATGRFGPPKFSSAEINFSEAQVITIELD